MPAPRTEYLLDRIRRVLSERLAPVADSVGRRLDSQLPADEFAEFQAQPPEQYALFLEAAYQALDMPAVKVGGTVLSPAEYLRVAAEKSDLPATAVDNAIQSLLGMPFDEADEGALALRDALLGQLRDNLLGRQAEDGWDSGANPQELTEFADSPALEQRYRLTPEGEQGFQSERVYNLLSTFQNGEFTPVWADAGSKVLGALGAPFDFRSGVPGATPYLAANRNNTPAGRLNESLYWWRQGEPDGTAATSAGGAKYPSLSSTTLEGVTTKLDTTDNYLPYYNQQLFERYLFNLDLEPGEREQLQQMRDDLFRITPRYPEGADPREMRQLARDLRDFDSKARGFANAEYPELVRNYGLTPQAWGGGHTWTGQMGDTSAIGTPQATYLSPFGEMLANFPRDMVDVQTLGTLGLSAAAKAPSLLGGLLTASKAGPKGVVKQAGKAAVGAIRRAADATIGDLPNEVPINTAMQAVNTPTEGSTWSQIGQFFAPQETSIVTDDEGQPVPANDPNYRRHLERTYGQRKTELRSLLDRGTQVYGRGIPAAAP
jgi:hypothetical protein